MASNYDMGDALKHWLVASTSSNFLKRVALWTSVLFLLVYAIFGRGFFAGYGEFLQSMYEMQSAPDDVETAKAVFREMGAWFKSMIFVTLTGWAVFASAETAFHKNTLHKIDHGAFPLRFGKTELHVMIAQLAVYLSALGTYIGAALFMVLAIAIGALIASFSKILGGIFMVVFVLLGAFAMIAGMFVVMVRLSPASAMTVRDDKLRIFDAWKVSKPHFWPMFGSYLVIGIIGYVVIYVVMLTFMFMVFGDLAVFNVIMGLSHESPNEVFGAIKGTLKTPRVMSLLIIGSISYLLVTVTWYMALWGIPNMAVMLDSEVE